MDPQLAELIKHSTLAFGIMIAGAVIVFLIFIGVSLHKDEFLYLVIGAISTVVVATVGSLGIGLYYEKDIDARRNELGYVYYIDGQEVDRNLIDLHQYRISYDDENKRAYMTSRGMGR